MEKFGINSIEKTINEDLVFCTNCSNTYYENISDERNNNALVLFFDKKNEEYFKGCPKCEIDKFLSNIS